AHVVVGRLAGRDRDHRLEQQDALLLHGPALVVFCIAVNLVVKRSKLGYYLQAIREDQDAAHSLGIPLTLCKNAALGISAALTALAGSFAALYIGFIEPQAVFGIDISIQLVLICIIGGIGTVT